MLNDTYREAERLGIGVDALVVADDDFDAQWRSTGIAYPVILESRAPIDDLERLRTIEAKVAEIPRAIRAGTRLRGTGEALSRVPITRLSAQKRLRQPRGTGGAMTRFVYRRVGVQPLTEPHDVAHLAMLRRLPSP